MPDKEKIETLKKQAQVTNLRYRRYFIYTALLQKSPLGDLGAIKEQRKYIIK